MDEALEKFKKQEIFDGTLSLDSIAFSTLGRGKTGHGAHAPELIAKKKWAEVFAYNLQDVRLTKELFEFIKKYHYILDGKGRKIILGKI